MSDKVLYGPHDQIYVNKENIETQAEELQTQSQSIAENATAIANNTTKLNTIEDYVDNLGVKVGENTNDIKDIETSIETNTSDILDLKHTTENNTSSIETNTDNISSLVIAVDTNTNNIAQNTNDIAELQTLVGEDVSYNFGSNVANNVNTSENIYITFENLKEDTPLFFTCNIEFINKDDEDDIHRFVFYIMVPYNAAGQQLFFTQKLENATEIMEGFYIDFDVKRDTQIILYNSSDIDWIVQFYMSWEGGLDGVSIEIE